MTIGIPVYQGVDLFDMTGPYEMFKWADSPDHKIEVPKRCAM
jgi:putative intracellular protease/amidase